MNKISSEGRIILQEDQDFSAETINFEKNNIISNKKFSKLISTKDIKPLKFSKRLNFPFGNINDILNLQTADDSKTYSNSTMEYLMHRFQIINKCLPTVCYISEINANKFLNNLFYYCNVPEQSYNKRYSLLNNPDLHTFSICISKNIFLVFNYNFGGYFLYDESLEKDKNSSLYILLGLLKYCKKPLLEKNKIFIVYQSKNGFDKHPFDIKKIKVNLEENYNEDFIEKSKKIITGLNDKNKTNLVILSGPAGTGKTTFLRYLASKLKKNIIFIPPDLVDSITSPSFIPFLLNNNDCILIVEDAEPVLEKRHTGGRSSGVSNVLNLTDGLLSDCLNISIIATFNINTKNIDDALMRKGRLLMHYHFDYLNEKKSKELLEKLGHKEIEVKAPMSLADIYYYNNGNGNEVKPIKLGFK